MKRKSVNSESGRTCDLLIVGGGPAGSTLGVLTKKYLPSARITILERAAFPRHHIGESLLPAIRTVLEEMEVLDQINAAGFPKKMGITHIWGKDRKPWVADFQEMTVEELISIFGDIPKSAVHAWQVRRAEYDKILLDHARSRGVEVLQANAESILEENGRIVGAAIRGQDGETFNMKCRLLADCSGQAGFLSKVRPIRDFDPRLKNVAAYAYFRGAPWKTKFTGHPDKTRIFVCSTGCGWFWYIPLSQDLISVGLVTTHRQIVENKIKDMRAFFKKELYACGEIAELIKSAQWEQNVDGTGKDFFTISDWSYLCRQAAGDGWVAAGDAAAFVDPIFSSGVTFAQLCARRAAYAISAAWKGTSPALEKAIWKDYSAFCRESATIYLVMALYWYGNDRSQRLLWKTARDMYQARAPESISDAKAYVAVVSGVLQSNDQLAGFNFDRPRLKEIYQGVWEQNPSVIEADLKQVVDDRQVPTLKCPFSIQLTFLPNGQGALTKGAKIKFHKHDSADPMKDIFNPRMLATNWTLPILRLIDGRRTVGEIKAILSDRSKIDLNFLKHEFHVLFRQLAVWKIVQFIDGAAAGREGNMALPLTEQARHRATSVK